MKKHFRLYGNIVCLHLLLFACPSVHASYGIYVGKNLTADGSVFLAGYGDEPSSHWLEIVPARTHEPDATVSVGVTDRARYPGELMDIPQARRTFKYITMSYSAFAGFPAPLTNGGMNEHHVAARDIWSPSRPELREMTPNPQRGPSYSDLARIAMERARTAREAVEIIGGLMDEYGFSTYGGNSHLFADPDEGWIVINFAGGKGLWAAERLGPDDIRVSRPGYIGEIPGDYMAHPDYMGSDNLISFAVEQGWYDPESGEPFNVNLIYGDGEMRHEAVAMMEERLKGLAPRITLEDMIAAVRTPEITRDSAGYGTVAHLRGNVRSDLGVMWIAATSSTTAPFIPWHMGATGVPPEFARHRYLTEDEAAAFQEPDDLGLESTRYAFRVFKRLFYLVAAHPADFLAEVIQAFEAFEAGLIRRQKDVETTARILFDAGGEPLARDYLTRESARAAMDGLRLGEALAGSIEARTKVLYGIERPTGEKSGGIVDVQE